MTTSSQANRPIDPVVVREFRRTDRDQLAALVNAHIAAVIPGGSVSVQVLLSTLEDEPGEYIVNPWVVGRTTLVAEQRGRLVAAAHLVRYGSQPPVSESLRNTGEIRFLLYWPPSTLFADTENAARDLMAASAARLLSWGVDQVTADGTLPAPGVYGVPEQWPHVRRLYEQHGFTTPHRTEVVMLAQVSGIAQPTGPYTAVRSVGMNGTRIDAILHDRSLGYIEIDTSLDSGGRLSRFTSWADVGNVVVTEPARRPELTRWLLGQAGQWLQLAGVTHLLAYEDAGNPAETELLCAAGFRVLTTVSRGFSVEAGRWLQ